MLRFPEVLGEVEPFVLVESHQASELLALVSRHKVQVIDTDGPGFLRRIRFPQMTALEVRNLLVFLAVSEN